MTTQNIEGKLVLTDGWKNWIQLNQGEDSKRIIKEGKLNRLQYQEGDADWDDS